MTAWQEDGGRGGNDAPETLVVRPRGRGWILTQRALIGFLILLLIALFALWLARKPIANNILARELEKRGVTASYHLDRIGLRTQQISDLVIGDPRHPDLTARVAQVQMRLKWNGSVEVYRVVARGVRLRGRVIGRRVSWGQVDRLLPPPSGKPFRLPNVVVDVADTAIRLDSPYGRIGIGVIGAGNLSGGFRGRLAVAAPRLVPGQCRLDAFRASVRVSVDARRPHVVGPLTADQFICPRSNLRLAQARAEIDSRFAEAFDEFTGKGRLTLGSLVAGANGLANVTSALTFAGTPTQIGGTIELGAQKARLAEIIADRTRLDGSYHLDARRGALALVADYGANGAALAPAMTRGLIAPLDAAAKTPIGPIATAISGAIGRAAGGFDVDGKLRLVNLPGKGGVRIESADARSASGGRVLVSGGDGITYHWPSGRIRIDGRIQTSGGGLPTADIALSQPRSGAPMSGTADFAPYVAGNSRLALAPVQFRARNDGATEVTTVALLDGPVGDGRVTGLRVPISGVVGGQGGFAFGRGCIDARFASLRTGSLRLGATRVPLCPIRGAILSQAPGGPLRVGAVTRNLRLAGQLGQSPFRLNAGRAAMTDAKNFEAAALALRLGRDATPVLINAQRLRGTFSGRGIRGTFAGGDALIGKVPLKISKANGTWLMYRGDISVNSSLTVADQADPPRFTPLVSDNVRFTLAGGKIRANGALHHPASGTKVTDVAITHDLGTGNGQALLDVPGIRFAQGGLQPEDLTRLTEGIIALVNGSIDGEGRIAWSGSAPVKSTGIFNIRNTDLAAAFGPVTGLNTTVRFTDLLGLETAPGQSLTMHSINPGILVENGAVRYQLLPGKLVKIERGEWPFMGGQLILRETVLNFNRPTAKRLTFEVVGLDAKTFVDSMGFKEIAATGVFDGVLPMIFDEQGGRIVGGRLDSRPGGGTLAYNGVVNKANLGMVGGLAFDALRDLRFQSMIIRLDGYLDGEFATRLTVEGVGLGNTSTQRFIRAVNKIPFKFNVTIKGPFRALIATAKSFRDPRNIITDALPRPLDEVPGIVTEVRRREEQQTQTQTPVDEQVDVSTKPTK